MDLNLKVQKLKIKKMEEYLYTSLFMFPSLKKKKKKKQIEETVKIDPTSLSGLHKKT